MHVMRFPPEKNMYFAYEGIGGRVHDYIPPKDAFCDPSACDRMYLHLKDVHEMTHLRHIRPSTPIYLAQSKREGAFPPGLYRLSTVCR